MYYGCHVLYLTLPLIVDLWKVKQNIKYQLSVSCSECLQLVTAITFIDIMVFGIELALCLSNRNTIFWLIPDPQKFKNRL